MNVTCQACPFYKATSHYGSRTVQHWCHAEPGAPILRERSESFDAPRACRLHPNFALCASTNPKEEK